MTREIVFSRRRFQALSPDMPGEMESELEEVVRILAENWCAWRLHATYGPPLIF